MLRYVPDYFKTRKMCEGVFEKYPWTLKYVPDWLVTQQQVYIWNNYHCARHCTYYNNEMIKWYDGYKKRKAQKVLIKEELTPVTWHPSGICVCQKMKKKDRKIVGVITDSFKIIQYAEIKSV